MGLPDRVNEAVCHRAFSGPEALLYERFVAAGVLDCVAPAIEVHARGPRVLDVGCGGGLLAERLGAQGHELVGVDPSLPQVRRAARAGHPS